MSNEYKITTLKDIVSLDEDQIDRICAELPGVLKYCKAMISVGDALSKEGAIKLVEPLTWIDDGKQDIKPKFITNKTSS